MSWLPDWLTGYDAENAARAAAADAQLQKLNQADYERGGRIYNAVADARGVAAAEQNLATVLANRDREINGTDDGSYTGVGGYSEDVQREQIQTVFQDTLDVQAGKIIGGPFAAIGSFLKSIFKAVPWWVWLLGIVAVFVWLGGAALLKGILARKKKTA